MYTCTLTESTGIVPGTE